MTYARPFAFGDRLNPFFDEFVHPRSRLRDRIQQRTPILEIEILRRHSPIDLRHLESRQRDIEALGRHKVDQLAELDRQDFAISTGLFGEFVVGDHIGALLRRGEMVETDNRHVSKVFQLRCLKTPMAGKNHIGVIDKHGV